MTPSEGSGAEETGHRGEPVVEHDGRVEELVEEVEAERALLAKAIGGWRGLFDSGLPAAVFVVVYLVDGNVLAPALWAAVGSGVVIAVWRIVRRESLQQVLAGFVGVAVSAFVAARTGRAEDYFLPGLLTNLAYGTAFLVSILVRWPLIGVVVGMLTGEGTSWRSDPDLRRAYTVASWVWVGVFFGRMVVQVPLYLAGAVGPLGVAKIVMGWPLFLAAAYVTYRLLRPALHAARERAAAASPAGPASRAALAADDDQD